MDNPGGDESHGAWGKQGVFLHSSPCSGLAWDPAEERLWLADTAGCLASYTYPDLSLHTRTRACFVSNYDDPLWSISAFRGSGLRPQAAAR